MSFFRTLRPMSMLACCLTALGATRLRAADPRLNEIQAIGSHNSYHIAPPAGVLEALEKLRKGTAKDIGRSMPPLTVQLDAGLRQFEFDIHADPAGGLYAKPFAMTLAALGSTPVPPYDPDGVMLKPGFKLLHIPDIDCWSNNRTLASALAEMSKWSASHPDHLPFFLLIECKDEGHPPLPTKPVPFDRARLLALEQEILGIIPKEKIFRPDDLRGEEQSLPEAIKNQGWPALDALRGKFIFGLDNTGSLANQYLEGNSALEGRLLFVSPADEKSPCAAWFKCNDPIKEFDRIQKLVKLGFVVRTRSDTDGPDSNMRAKAFASGAQWVSTDCYDAAQPAGSRVIFDGDTLVRSNPVSTKTPVIIAP